MASILASIASILGAFFFLLVGATVFRHFSMFGKRHGRTHRLIGAFYLVALACGMLDRLIPIPLNLILYDSVLGVLGTALTLSAAFEFQHKNIKNSASGTLDSHTIVTFEEMIEHSFYQILNLVQALYLHAVASSSARAQPLLRVVLLFTVTSPWLFRHRFPINKFSDNYTKIDAKVSLSVGSFSLSLMCTHFSQLHGSDFCIG